MIPAFAKKSETAIPIYVVESDNLKSISIDLNIADWVITNQFQAALGKILIIPNDKGSISSVLVGWGSEATRSRGRFHMGAAAANSQGEHMKLYQDCQVKT